MVRYGVSVCLLLAGFFLATVGWAGALTTLYHSGKLGIDDTQNCVDDNGTTVCTWLRYKASVQADPQWLHVIDSQLYVPSGVRLVIQAGARIEATAGVQLIVQSGGEISIQGEQFRMLTTFTNREADNDWSGIRIESGAVVVGNVIENLLINYANGVGLDLAGQGDLNQGVVLRKVTVGKLFLRLNTSVGIRVRDNSVVLIEQSHVADGDYGIVVESSPTVSISQTWVENVSACGICASDSYITINAARVEVFGTSQYDGWGIKIDNGFGTFAIHSQVFNSVLRAPAGSKTGGIEISGTAKVDVAHNTLLGGGNGAWGILTGLSADVKVVANAVAGWSKGIGVFSTGTPTVYGNLSGANTSCNFQLSNDPCSATLILNQQGQLVFVNEVDNLRLSKDDFVDSADGKIVELLITSAVIKVDHDGYPRYPAGDVAKGVTPGAFENPVLTGHGTVSIQQGQSGVLTVTLKNDNAPIHASVRQDGDPTQGDLTIPVQVTKKGAGQYELTIDVPIDAAVSTRSIQLTAEGSYALVPVSNALTITKAPDPEPEPDVDTPDADALDAGVTPDGDSGNGTDAVFVGDDADATASDLSADNLEPAADIDGNDTATDLLFTDILDESDAPAPMDAGGTDQSTLADQVATPPDVTLPLDTQSPDAFTTFDTVAASDSGQATSDANISSETKKGGGCAQTPEGPTTWPLLCLLVGLFAAALRRRQRGSPVAIAWGCQRGEGFVAGRLVGRVAGGVTGSVKASNAAKRSG